MENQITPETTSFQPTGTQVENNEPIKKEVPKQNSFLVVLLSVLLLASVAIAGFFAFQTQKLVNELQVMRDEPKQTAQKTTEPTEIPIATESATASPSPVSTSTNIASPSSTSSTSPTN